MVYVLRNDSVFKSEWMEVQLYCMDGVLIFLSWRRFGYLLIIHAASFQKQRWISDAVTRVFVIAFVHP